MAKLEYSRKCITIEEKLEWIEAELKQSSPDINLVTSMLDGILSRLEEQEKFLDGGDKFNSKNVKEFLKAFPKMIDGKRRSTINLWLRKVRPINITQLLQYINETETAAKMLENQDVVMFLGTSQSGKSTTIHFLTGSKFSFNGKALHIEQSSKHVDVDSVKTGFNLKSTTRFINPVKIPAEALNNLGVVSGSYTSDGIILCDAPGFGDTQGAEMDISNGIGITRALQRCRSVKFLFVCSDQIGDTGGLFKRIIETVGSMFYSIDDHLDAFSYIFTKWNDSSLIYDKLAAIRDAVIEKESPESPLYLISEHMVQSIENKIYLVEPCSGNPAEILNMVISNISKIENTQETFKDFVSSESLLKLMEYCRMVEIAIPMALAQREVSVMTKKMQQLCEINNKVKTNEGMQAQQHCTQAICGHLDMVQSYFDEICDRICDPSAVSVLMEDKKWIVTCFEDAIDLATIMQYVERDTLIPHFATRLEKLTMEFCQTFGNTFSDKSDSEGLNATAESEHITVSDLSTASVLREKAYCVKEILLSSEKLSNDNRMKETISYIYEQYELMESRLNSRCQFFTKFMVSEYVQSNSLPKLLTLLDYMTELKSLFTHFPRVNPEHSFSLVETTDALIQRFRITEEDASAIFNKDAHELYLMDANNLRQMVEQLEILSSLANNPTIKNILTTEQIDIVKASMEASSKSLHVLSRTLMLYLTSLLPSLDSIQVIAFAEVQKFSYMLGFCDSSAFRNYTIEFNRYMASCSQYLCDSLKCLESNDSAPMDIDTLRVAFINLSTAFEESEAKQYLSHTLEVFRDIVHRLKEYASKVSFDSMSCSVFMRLHKITEIEKIPLFGYEGSENLKDEAMKSSIATEVKEIRLLYDAGVITVEKIVLHVLYSENMLNFDFKTITDSLLIVPHLPHGSTAAHYVQSFRTFITQKLPTYWAEIKEAFNKTNISEGDDVVALMKTQLKTASMDWAGTISKLVTLREQFKTSSFSFPHGHSEAVELFDTLPTDIISTSITEALSYIAECKDALLMYPLIATIGRRWVDLTSTSVTMWVDPILSNGSLLNTYNIADSDGLSFRSLSDLFVEKLRLLTKDLKSEISFATSAKRWAEVSDLLKTRKDDLSSADLDEVTSDLAKVVQEESELLLASTEIYSSPNFPQIFEESIQQLQTIIWAHKELSSLVLISIIDASKVAACEKNIQNLIQNRIKDSFDILVEKKSFRLLEEYVQSLEDILSKLSSFPMQCRAPDCEQYSDYSAYLSHIISLKNEQIDGALQDAVNFICEQDIPQYYQNPPSDVIDTLKACENLRSNRYQLSYQGLKEWILNQYACLLYIDLSKRVVSVPSGTSFEQYEEVYRQATKSRSYIPRDFVADVNDLCNLAEKFITQQKSSLEIERISCELQNLSEYIGIFRRHCSESNFNHARVIKANIEKSLASQIKVIGDRLDDKDFMHAIDHFNIFSKHLMLYDTTLGQLKDNLISTSTTTCSYQILEARYYIQKPMNFFRGKTKSVDSHYYVVINGIRHTLPCLTVEEKRTMKSHHTFVYSEGRTEELQLYSQSEVTRKGLTLVERIKELFNTSVSTLGSGDRFDISLHIVVKFLRSASTISNGEPVYLLKKNHRFARRKN